LQRNFQDLSNGKLQAHKFLKISVGKPKKQMCNHLATAKQAGQKNRNERMIAALFCNVFY
jgi:hypothetical protein